MVVHVSRRRRKTYSSLSFKLRSLGENFYNVFSWLLVLLTAGILAGMLYVIITGAPYAASFNDRMVFVVPARTSLYSAVKQTIVETVGVWFLLVLITLGLYLVLASSEKPTTSRMANSMFLMGIAMFLLGALGLILVATVEKRIALLP